MVSDGPFCSFSALHNLPGTNGGASGFNEDLLPSFFPFGGWKEAARGLSFVQDDLVRETIMDERVMWWDRESKSAGVGGDNIKGEMA